MTTKKSDFVNPFGLELDYYFLGQLIRTKLFKSKNNLANMILIENKQLGAMAPCGLENLSCHPLAAAKKKSTHYIHLHLGLEPVDRSKTRSKIIYTNIGVTEFLQTSVRLNLLNLFFNNEEYLLITSNSDLAAFFKSVSLRFEYVPTSLLIEWENLPSDVKFSNEMKVFVASDKVSSSVGMQVAERLGIDQMRLSDVFGQSGSIILLPMIETNSYDPIIEILALNLNVPVLLGNYGGKYRMEALVNDLNFKSQIELRDAVKGWQHATLTFFANQFRSLVFNRNFFEAEAQEFLRR